MNTEYPALPIASIRTTLHGHAAQLPVCDTDTGSTTVGGTSAAQLLWLGEYLYTRREHTNTWIVDDMGWLLERIVCALTDETVQMVERILAVVRQATDRRGAVLSVPPVAMPVVQVIRTTHTAEAMSVEVECTHTTTVTSTWSGIEHAFDALLHRALALCSSNRGRTLFSIRDYWDAPLLHLAHPVTETPPELFDYLFGTAAGRAARIADAAVGLTLSVERCSVQYRMDAPESADFRIVLHFGLIDDDAAGTGSSFLPLKVEVQSAFVREGAFRDAASPPMTTDD